MVDYLENGREVTVEKVGMLKVGVEAGAVKMAKDEGQRWLRRSITTGNRKALQEQHQASQSQRIVPSQKWCNGSSGANHSSSIITAAAQSQHHKAMGN